MSRKSYEAYRAGKVAARRRGSVIESETDAESLASFTTYQSNASHLSHSGFPSSRLAPFHAPSERRYRTFSSSSSSHSPAPPSPRLSALRPVDERDKAREARRVRRAERERRREEKRKLGTLEGERYDSPLRRWLRWMSRNNLGHWSLPIALLGVGFIKTAVGYGGFSGKDTPPMYGDFEAQRHWMEVAINRPMSEWYTYGPHWWLLDYPPLTAYASWLCGKIGSYLDPSHFALDTSRGLSPPDLVTYLRFSVLTFEASIWWTAVVAWMITEGRRCGRSLRSQITGIATVLMQPSLMLIDNGHFQYNSVLLGFSLWTVFFLCHDQNLLACIAFSCALCFKQMGLYYAPAIGCYLVGKCLWLGGDRGMVHFAKLGAVTTATFGLIFSPWLYPFPDAISQVLHRIFPFARGIFEDKVANFWFASNVVIKWRNWVSVAGMARLATIATLAALLPTVCIILYTSLSSRSMSKIPANGHAPAIPTIKLPPCDAPPATVRLLPMAMFTASLSFFLFSFQVHEKSILLPLMPLTLMMAMRGKQAEKAEEELWEVGVLINNVAVFSMWPLLVRDGQALQYVVTSFLWNYIIGYSPLNVQTSGLRRAAYVVYSLMTLIHLPDILPSLLPPPRRYPDLYVVLNTLLSFVVFGLVWLWSHKKLLEGAWGIVGLGASVSERKLGRQHN